MRAVFRARGARTRVTRQVDGVGDVDRVAIDAELLGQDAAHQVLRHQAVLARVRAGGDGDREAGIQLLDRHVITVSLKRRGKGTSPFGIIHCFSPTGTAVPDHSPKMRTTIEMAAFFAPATMTRICRGPDRIVWNASSPSHGPRNVWDAPRSLPLSRHSRPPQPRASGS